MAEFVNRTPERSAPKVEVPITPEHEPLGSAEAVPQTIAPGSQVQLPEIQPSQGLPHAPTILEKKVESVLEEDLGTLYQELSPEGKIQFKIEGERTAVQIAQLLARAKVKINEIIKLIRDWLIRLPGLNKYFVEQAAKIKAAKIIHLH